MAIKRKPVPAPHYDFPPIYTGNRPGEKEIRDFTKSQIKKGLAAFGIKRKARKQTKVNIRSMAETDAKEYFKKIKMSPTKKAYEDTVKRYMAKYERQIPKKYR